MKKPVDLFQSKISEIKLHPAFCALRGSDIHADARSLINALYSRMGDPNGNFLKDFQTQGFHSRLFELACFAYLESAGFALNRSHESPDYLASSPDGVTIAIEATTANPTIGQATDLSLLQMESLSEAEIFEKVKTEFPRRITSILQKKLAHRYHELAHCLGKPLILMVAPFFESGAVFYTDESLLQCLYGVGEIATNNAVPFFDLPDANPISGVLYCNAFTVPRFFRMATQFEKFEGVRAVREGVCYFGDSDDSPHEFRFRVGDPFSPVEMWSEGVTLFVNPNASHPLQLDILPRTCTFSVRDNTVSREIHGFHPVMSFMFLSVPDATSKYGSIPQQHV